MDTDGRKNRLAIIDKIAEYERNEWFECDVEDDPPTRPLTPGEVDYAKRKLTSKIKTFVANRVAHAYFERLIRRGELVIKEVRGIENYRAVNGGAMLTCNHFNAYDNYAVFKAIERELPTRELYKIIREGNYTSFGGIYGYFFRNCNTLPLASNVHVLAELGEGVKTLLSRGEKILIYPEQGMWWNYRKPRPLKDGAFRFAAKNGVPVIPFFISMEDTDRADQNGFPIQAYTVHIMPAIYPDPDRSVRENCAAMRDQNYQLLKEKYEEVYGIPLTYSGK